MVDTVTEDVLMDLLDGRRKFVYENSETDEKTEYFLAMPSADDVRQADWEHAKTYNKALKEGIFTTSEMMDLLKQRNIIGDKYDEYGEQLQGDLQTLLIKMEMEKDSEEKRTAAVAASKKRDEIFMWHQRLNGPLASTCENMANDARVEYLTSCVVQKTDKTKVWSSLGDYRLPGDQELKLRARLEVMLWMEGLESDFMQNVPENKILFSTSEELTEEEESEKAAKEKIIEATPKTQIPDPPAPKKRARPRRKKKQ